MIVSKTTRSLQNANQSTIQIGYLNTLFSAIFILVSSYWVYGYEYVDGKFLYYFFKANIFYAQFNKIIFPLGYWILFLIYFLIIFRFSSLFKNQLKIYENIRLGIFFHFYLLVLTHWGEVIIDYSLFPVNLPPFPGQPEYEKFIMTIGVFFYYGYCWNLLFPNNVDSRPTIWIILPMSFFLPFIIIPFETEYLYLMIFSGLAFLSWRKLRIGKPKIQLNSQNPLFIPCLIYLLSLFFRIWYAYYFTSLGDKALGFSADGFSYYNSALAFLEGRIDDVDFYHAPFYAFYLAFLLSLFGKTIGALFFSQAIIGSLVPVLIYHIAKHFFNQRIAFVSGLLVACSQLCIHHSVVSHRIDPTLLLLPLMILICLKENGRGSFSSGSFFGMIALCLFYFAQEMVVSVVVIFSIWFFLKIKNFISVSVLIKSLLGFFFGVTLMSMPINLIFYSHYGKWIMLGRDISFHRGQIKLGFSSNPAIEKLERFGFDFFGDPFGSILLFLQKPIEIFPLFIQKINSETLAFLLDPGTIHFEPFLLNPESFLGAHIQFYLYLAICVGIFMFVKKDDLSFGMKLLILCPLIFQFVTVTLFIYGTFRYRVPITPLNLIFAGIAFEFVLLSPHRKLIFGSSYSYQQSYRKSLVLDDIKSHFYYIFGLACLGFIFWISIFNEHSNIPEQGQVVSMEPWITIDSKNSKLISYNKITINSPVFSYYSGISESGVRAFNLSFNFCRFLMPGPKPYYLIAIDGIPVDIAKPIGAGCSNVTLPVNPHYNSGNITLFVFASENGVFGKLEQKKIVLFNGSAVTIPLPQDFRLNPRMRDYSSQFSRFSYKYVKVSSPSLLAIASK